MGYLSATSRKLDEPLSILIQSRSAAGKSTLQDAVLSMVPEEDYIKYTRLTGRALFYKRRRQPCAQAPCHRGRTRRAGRIVLIRNIQSSKYLSIAATGKDPVTGKLRTEEYKVKGPVAMMITTTEVELDYETANRFITLTIDESKEMTERILQEAARAPNPGRSSQEGRDRADHQTSPQRAAPSSAPSRDQSPMPSFSPIPPRRCARGATT